MKISKREQGILPRVELRADAPLAEHAKATDCFPNQVRYALHRLETEGVIRKTVFVDMYRLGFCDYVLYFSIATKEGSPQAKDLLRFLEDSPLVTWVAELSGSYQYGIALFSRDVHEFVSFLDLFSKEFGQILFKKSIRLTRTFTRFNRKYLDPTAPTDEISFGLHPGKESIDKTDDLLLQAITLPGARSLRQTTLKLGIPVTTGHQRLKRLKERGIIAGHLYAIDAPKFGATLFNILIYAKGMREPLRKKLSAWAKKHPNVIHFIECVGEWDFEIGAEVMAPEQSADIVRDLFTTFGDELLNIDVIPILRNLKYVFYRPVF
ncbi:Lrp/AsnC family transcriptional regulator [Candidatus Uhrbacteria bacterium]|nr:Lrp/AsnC family transcriptional regulator [Candidatus Uhrbacteria bacterium]